MRESGRVSSYSYHTLVGDVMCTMSATRPVRRASRALSTDNDSAATFFACRKASSATGAPGRSAATAMCTTSAGRFRNAMPSPTDSRMGKASDQKSASGSRTNSRNRVSVSCRSESRIAQMAAGERYEHVLQRRRVRGQLGELTLIALEEPEQRGNRAAQLHRCQLEGGVVPSHGRDAIQPPQRGFVHVGLALEAEAHDVLGAERRDERARRTERDDLA